MVVLASGAHPIYPGSYVGLPSYITDAVGPRSRYHMSQY